MKLGRINSSPSQESVLDLRQKYKSFNNQINEELFILVTDILRLHYIWKTKYWPDTRVTNQLTTEHIFNCR